MEMFMYRIYSCLLYTSWLPHHSLTTEPFSAEKYYRDLKDMACMEIWVKPIPLEKKE